jgi:aquaglyceroporin related protein, other eukaryote
LYPSSATPEIRFGIDLESADEKTIGDSSTLGQGAYEDGSCLPQLHDDETIWSAIRTRHREALAEGLAVFIQLTLGLCGNLAVTMAADAGPKSTEFIWGFATMIAIYISIGISGAHLNPSITMMLCFYRGFPRRKILGYILAQFSGAFFAGLVAYGVYHPSVNYYLAAHSGSQSDIVNCFVTSQRKQFIIPTTAFFNEFVGMVVLVIVILALTDDQNTILPPGDTNRSASRNMNPLINGFVISCMNLCFSYQTGAALNPSRDFGPRLALLALGYGSKLFTNPYWFYGPWAASVSGAFTGAFLYDFLIFTGSNSPVNYPWKVVTTEGYVKKPRGFRLSLRAAIEKLARR